MKASTEKQSYRTLRFVLAPGVDTPLQTLEVVTDTTWTPRVEDRAVALRDVAGRLLASQDLFSLATDRLDAWADASGIVDRYRVEGSSLWFQVRLGHWRWLLRRLLWVGLLESLLEGRQLEAIELSEGLDEELVEVAGLIAQRDGVRCEPFARVPAVRAASAPRATPAAEAWPRFAARLGRQPGRIRAFLRRRRMRARLQRLVAAQPTVLVLREHALQQVMTTSGPREMNPFIDPILEQLDREGVSWASIEIHADVREASAWRRLMAVRNSIPVGALRAFQAAGERSSSAALAAQVAAWVIEAQTPLEVAGIDLGPSLAKEIAAESRRWLGGRLSAVSQMRRLMARMRPAALLLADEYSRHDWLAAARAEGIPAFAVQHGVIHPWHMGYIHRSRPPGLAIAQRTYVFGDWERRLLTGASVYREDEVLVTGSPREELARVAGPRDRAAVRASLGVEADQRLVVISGSWDALARRFHLPVMLAQIFDRPLPSVHVVVKLHPGEPDEGPYRAIIAGVAAARDFAPPPVTVVRDVDLYALLAAANAHLGLHSTVLTEAVVTGTLNLIGTTVLPADLLGYVEAGVAIPVRHGGDLLAALAGERGGLTAEARLRFVADHFQPGEASRRICDDLTARISAARSR